MDLNDLTIVITPTHVKIFKGNLSSVDSMSIIDTENSITELFLSGYEFYIVTDKTTGNYLQVFCENFSFEECSRILVLEQHNTLEEYLNDPAYSGLFK